MRSLRFHYYFEYERRLMMNSSNQIKWNNPILFSNLIYLQSSDEDKKKKKKKRNNRTHSSYSLHFTFVLVFLYVRKQWSSGIYFSLSCIRYRGNYCSYSSISKWHRHLFRDRFLSRRRIYLFRFDFFHSSGLMLKIIYILFL